jgi:energy-coupling factor transporter transmembrane protein EcfT
MHGMLEGLSIFFQFYWLICGIAVFNAAPFALPRLQLCTWIPTYIQVTISREPLQRCMAVFICIACSSLQLQFTNCYCYLVSQLETLEKFVDNLLEDKEVRDSIVFIMK